MDKREIIISSEHNDERIDSFVASCCEDISRSLAQTLIKEGKILLDGKETKVSNKVHENQVVTVPANIEKEIPEELVAEDIPIDVLYEDEDFLVVNKPKNMVVHPAVRQPFSEPW